MVELEVMVERTTIRFARHRVRVGVVGPALLATREWNEA
jgi:hypothetical protein